MTVRRTAGPPDWNVTGDVKNDIRRACRIEQSDLCAFCCARLSRDPELQRIAHVVPRDVDPARTLDFTNMVVSCSSGRDRLADAAVSPRAQSCDEAQGSSPLPIHPFEPSCRDAFLYLGNGAIRPAPVSGSKETISILNLDCDRLRQGRFRAIQGALTMRDRMDPADWDRIYRSPSRPHLPEFWPAIASLP